MMAPKIPGLSWRIRFLARRARIRARARAKSAHKPKRRGWRMGPSPYRLARLARTRAPWRPSAVSGSAAMTVDRKALRTIGRRILLIIACALLAAWIIAFVTAFKARYSYLEAGGGAHIERGF